MDYRTSFLPLLLAIGISAPAQAATERDIGVLANLIEETGTKIVGKTCRDGQAGFYEFDADKKLDQLVICNNNVSADDNDALWEVLAHEATHVMQACLGNTVLKEEFHPRMWREIDSKAPHYSKILNSSYSSGTSINEAEAFWMELQHPDLVTELFKLSCFKQPEK